jgi:hypothetical protein
MLAQMPVTSHQHVDELIAFGWSVQAEEHRGIDTAIATLLSFERNTDTPQAQAHRYYLTTRITEASLTAIEQQRNGALGLSKRCEELKAAQEKIIEASRSLSKVEGLEATRLMFGSYAPEEVSALRRDLVTTLPTLEDATKRVEASKPALSEAAQTAADSLLAEYKRSYSFLMQMAGSREALVELAAENAQETFQAQRKEAAEEWSSLLRKHTAEVMAALTPEERKQVADAITLYGDHYEGLVRRHYEESEKLAPEPLKD